MATKMQFGLSTMLLVWVVFSVGLMVVLNQRTLSTLVDEVRRTRLAALTDHCTVIDSWSSRLTKMSRQVDDIDEYNDVVKQQLQNIVLDHERRIKKLEAELARHVVIELPLGCQ